MSKNIQSPAENFFIKILQKSTKESPIINDIKRRIYGILDIKVTNKNEKFKNSHKQNIFYENKIKTNKNLSNILARQAHSGTNWQKFDLEKLKGHLQHQMYGGRSVEILLAEAMMRYFSEDFHFLPPKNIDLQNKIDFVSRKKFLDKNLGKIRTFGFGIQITLAEIGNQRYNEKLEEISSISQNFDKTFLEENFGRLTTPDIIGYIAINGKIGEQIRKNDGFVLEKFNKWKKQNFENNGIIDFLKEKDKAELYEIAKIINQTQKYILSEEFLKKIEKNFNFTKSENNFLKNFDYQKSKKTLKIELIKNNEKIAILHFFLNEKIIENLQKIQ